MRVHQTIINILQASSDVNIDALSAVISYDTIVLAHKMRLFLHKNMKSPLPEC